MKKSFKWTAAIVWKPNIFWTDNPNLANSNPIDLESMTSSKQIFLFYRLNRYPLMYVFMREFVIKKEIKDPYFIVCSRRNKIIGQHGQNDESNFWPVTSLFWPDIVYWPAIILSPVTCVHLITCVMNYWQTKRVLLLANGRKNWGWYDNTWHKP